MNLLLIVKYKTQNKNDNFCMGYFEMALLNMKNLIGK